jgi:hypothetical protein
LLNARGVTTDFLERFSQNKSRQDFSSLTRYWKTSGGDLDHA